MSASGDGPTCALAVYAHPDDPEIAAGGTLAKWAASGTEVWVLIVAQGEKGTLDPHADLAALAAQRVEETAAAAALLGFAGHRHLGHRDGEVPDDQVLRGAIVRAIRELRPEAVMCPDPTSVLFGDGYFNHHDHRVTGWATLDAVASAAANPHYFPEQIEEGLSVHQARAVYLSGTLEPNTWIDIGDTLERKIDALFCHTSQLEHAEADDFRQFLRDRAEEASATSGARYTEAFRKLQLAA